MVKMWVYLFFLVLHRENADQEGFLLGEKYFRAVMHDLLGEPNPRPDLSEFNQNRKTSCNQISCQQVFGSPLGEYKSIQCSMAAVLGTFFSAFFYHC